MGPKASADAVYDLKYHFSWSPKYRKELLIGDVMEAAREIIEAKAGTYGVEIDTLEVMEDQLYVFISSPARYSPTRVTQTLESVSVRDCFSGFPG